MDTNKKMVWAGRVISGLVVLPFLMSAVMKLKGAPEVLQGMEHLGIPANVLFPLGLLELTCIALYAIPFTSVFGAILMAGYMGGTIITHWRVGESPHLQIIFGLVIWLGLWLREPRLRAILPLRK